MNISARRDYPDSHRAAGVVSYMVGALVYRGYLTPIPAANAVSRKSPAEHLLCVSGVITKSRRPGPNIYLKG